ncbi:MAG: TonB-dependent receptor [Cytophagales bacterium CG12_big_fil_rev_8_21_14_0_65_40_12]|nr:MAG: TonB-dependent receptor [Cytophagales bacterium CG12_big_fil_rev_8_21_14_0_65_40_12]PIW05855.1 MAG: TonB-dependent receptor [Cytophagales bacterium CG17_big_fil_post_rev_8_21_14_2_50_40_13]
MEFLRNKAGFKWLTLRLGISTMLLFFSIIVKSQTGVIVLDKSAKPIAGASVKVKDSNVGTTTDEKGTALLNISSPTVIIISHIGFESTETLMVPGVWRTITLEAMISALSDVVVEGFLTGRDLNEQAGSISTINLESLKRFDQASLVQAVNTVPGIRFEERAVGSYRISIRGSSVRSPFGVRNLKVYWNGIPFTEPGGNTFINLLDLTNIAHIEIIKGPASSIYGAGTGGVIKLKSTVPAELNNSLQLTTTAGSFGLLKSDLLFNQLDSKSSFTLKLARQKADGYRDHNAMDRKTFEIEGLLFPKSNQTLAVSLLYSDLFYEIPGALNPAQREENRKQARPGSAERYASIDNQYLLAKVSYEFDYGTDWHSKFSVFGSKLNFENPFNLDYKIDEQSIIGSRLEIIKDINIQGKEGSVIFGGEIQNSNFNGKNFGNVLGVADTINFEDNIDSKQSLLFASFEIEPIKDLFVNASVSRNALNYDIDRVVDKINNNPQRFNKEFETVWAPRLAISKKLSDHNSIHFSISKGFSPPTTTEVRTNEGSINRDLQPEKGINYEWNFRGDLLQNKVTYDLALFRFDLKESISSYTNQDGVVLFRNAGKNLQNGLELQLNAELLNQEQGYLRKASASVAYTYHDFIYDEFINNGDDFSGNALPGTAKNVVNLLVHTELSTGLNLNFNYHYSDAIPLNDGNTVYSRPYNLLNMTFNYPMTFNKKLGIEFFGGMNNIFDVDYSLGNDLNAFGNRYFQPAPERNYFFGLKLKFNYREQ